MGMNWFGSFYCTLALVGRHTLKTVELVSSWMFHTQSFNILFPKHEALIKSVSCYTPSPGSPTFQKKREEKKGKKKKEKRVLLVQSKTVPFLDCKALPPWPCSDLYKPTFLLHPAISSDGAKLIFRHFGWPCCIDSLGNASIKWVETLGLGHTSVCSSGPAHARGLTTAGS